MALDDGFVRLQTVDAGPGAGARDRATQAKGRYARSR